MVTRQPILSRTAVKALLALTKTRCKESDHALRPPVCPDTVYRLNKMLPSTETLKSILPTGLRYVVVGGVASAHYQPARFTQDIDLMVLAEDAKAVEESLLGNGWTQVGAISFGGSSWQSADGEFIDLRHAPKQAWVTAALDSPVEISEGLKIIKLPYLIILKLSATRAVDISDIVGMLQHANEAERQRVRQVMERYRHDLLEDFGQFSAIAQLS